jgi:hypothetical protein
MDARLEQFGLSDGGRDDILVFWRSADYRRAVLTADYTPARAYLSRLLTRLHALSYEHSVASQLTTLLEAGTALAVHVRGHRLGLIRSDR